MSKAREYRRNARECRRLASSMGADAHRDQLLEMAATWERMAAEREKHPLLDEDRSFGPTRGKGGRTTSHADRRSGH